MSFFISPNTLVLATAMVLSSASAFSQQAPAAKKPALKYESTFDTYRPFGDAALVPWRQANEDVQKAGGWRAYAKEAHAPSAPPPPALPARPAPTASGAKP
jgi:hypothetical protein